MHKARDHLKPFPHIHVFQRGVEILLLEGREPIVDAVRGLHRVHHASHHMPNVYASVAGAAREVQRSGVTTIPPHINSFLGLWFSTPRLLLGLRVLQPNTPFRA